MWSTVKATIKRTFVASKQMQNEGSIKFSELGQVWWLMPVIPGFWEAKASGSPKVGSSRPDSPTWRNPVSTKNRKLARHGGTCL